MYSISQKKFMMEHDNTKGSNLSCVADAAPLFIKLGEHPEYIPFFTVSSINSKIVEIDQILKPENQHIHNLSILTNFYNLKLLRNPPKFERKIPKLEYLFGADKMQYNKLLFVETKIFKARKKKYHQDVKFLDNLIAFVFDNPPSNLPAILEPRIADITEYIENDSANILALNSYMDERIRHFHIHFIEDQAQIKNEMNQILTYFITFLDQETCLLPGDLISQKFDYYLTKFPFCEGLNNVMANYEDLLKNKTFIPQLFEQINSTSFYFDFSKAERNIVIILLIFRYLFNSIYYKNMYFSPFNSCVDVIGELRNITLESLDLPLDFLPKNIDISLTPSQFFRNDPLFKDAVNELNEINFLTNPLDILGAVHKGLFIIEYAATQYSVRKVLIFPFEVSFGLFLANLLSCEIPQLLQIAEFVEACTPRHGLCPSIEFAKAKILGSSLQCKEMFDSMKKTKNKY
ncbi:hypothetical protein TRFO_32182 [Tritrichomonas foetus]|uniref:VPS9 domain-containing protein n=1 Tax=Tritrichomonas foetus TaxID=1144522 RepID=A0A1J4JTX9_9EUKA|nr:hypothetical protein TRFO_32182 [Tritrichomonas foetus]|eukprot:OHT00966.1 hypothetical protein TRFO_32182 [Tritrichomonas foetus]